MVYQHLVSSPEPYVEYVEEVSVEHGPKWTPSSTSKLTLRAVYQYLEWIVKKGAFISQSAAPAAEKASGIPQEYGILNCYMLRLGSTFDEAVQVLGAPTSVKNEFVNSAGIWGATVTWQNKEAICDARFQPDLKLYRISDLTRFEEELKDIMRKRSLTNK